MQTICNELMKLKKEMTIESEYDVLVRDKIESMILKHCDDEMYAK